MATTCLVKVFSLNGNISIKIIKISPKALYQSRMYKPFKTKKPEKNTLGRIVIIGAGESGKSTVFKRIFEFDGTNSKKALGEPKIVMVRCLCSHLRLYFKDMLSRYKDIEFGVSKRDLDTTLRKLEYFSKDHKNSFSSCGPQNSLKSSLISINTRL